MALPQEIRPINSELADSIARSLRVDAVLVSVARYDPQSTARMADVVRECALVVPPPEDPLPCPPAESDFRSHFDDSGAFYN